MIRSTPIASNDPFGPVPLSMQRTNMTSLVGRVLDRLSAEIGNEVEQIDDALGIFVWPPGPGA
jgi:hypothetical protein